MKRTHVIASSIALGLVGVAVGGYMAFNHASANAASVKSQKAESIVAAQTVATVNGDRVTDADIASAMNAGADKAVAVDRAINKTLAAQLAEKSYAKDAEAALAAVQRDVLSQLYIAKRSESIRAGVTDADVKSYYDKSIDAKAFTEYKVSALVTQDPKQAEQIAGVIASGKASEVASKFEPVADGKYLKAPDLPYGLGQVVSQLKAGEYSRPLALRNGIFLLHVSDVKAGVKPDVSKLSNEIKDLIVAQRLNDELTKARQEASISIK